MFCENLYNITLFKLLFLFILCGLYKHTHGRDEEYGLRRYVEDVRPSSIILSTLFNEHSANWRDTSMQVEQPIKQRRDVSENKKENNEKVDETDKEQVADKSEEETNGADDDAVELNDVNDDDGAMELKALKPEPDLEVNREEDLSKRAFTYNLDGRSINNGSPNNNAEFDPDARMTVDQFFPGGFSKVPLTAEPNKTDNVQRFLNKVQHNLHDALEQAMKEIYFFIAKSEDNKEDDLATRHNSNIYSNPTKQFSPSSHRNEGNDISERNLPYPHSRYKKPYIPQPVLDKFYYGTVHATGETDMWKVLQSLPSDLLDDLLKLQEIRKINDISGRADNADELLERSSEKSDPSDLMTLVAKSDEIDLSSRSRGLPLLSDFESGGATELLSASYLNDDDLSAVLNIVNRGKEAFRKGDPDCHTNLIYMFLINSKDGGSAGPSTARYPVLYRSPMKTPLDALQKASRANILTTTNPPPTGLPHIEYNRPLFGKSAMLSGRSFDDRMERKPLAPSDLYPSIVPKPFKPLHTAAIDSNRHFGLSPIEYDLVPHYDLDSDDNMAHQLDAVSSSPLTTSNGKCHCANPITKHVSNLLNILESKPVTKTEFINYLLYIIDKTQADPVHNNAILNEAVMYDKQYCNC